MTGGHQAILYPDWSIYPILSCLIKFLNEEKKKSLEVTKTILFPTVNFYIEKEQEALDS